MKRFNVTAILLLLCIVSPTSMKAGDKKPTVDMSNVKTIFVGWVNLDPDTYRVLDYDTKAEWAEVIDEFNAYFQGELKTNYLAGRTLTMAKNKDDENAAGNDLYIKFTDVSEDKGYRLHIAVHFIDPKTNTELAVIPAERYGAHVCGLVKCMDKEIDKVGELVSKQVSPKK
jgi:hypothetical protein